MAAPIHPRCMPCECVRHRRLQELTRESWEVSGKMLTAAEAGNWEEAEKLLSSLRKIHDEAEKLRREIGELEE